VVWRDVGEKRENTTRSKTAGCKKNLTSLKEIRFFWNKNYFFRSKNKGENWRKN
jgi:hypothetical protein